MVIARLGRRQQRHIFRGRHQNLRGSPSRKAFRLLLIILAIIAMLPPIFFHFKLRHFHQMQFRTRGWLNNPPLVCADGGDSSKAFQNTMTAYHVAFHSHVDCMEIDVSHSSDGVLFALHDSSLETWLSYDAGRDLQWISRNNIAKVGYLSMKQVILDTKVGPPSFDKGLAKDILSLVVYIVMKGPSTGARSNLLRMRGASVASVYHPLIDEKLVNILDGKKKVYAWTVDDAISMKRIVYEHVDVVVTSNPTLLQQLMKNIKTQWFEEGFSFVRMRT